MAEAVAAPLELGTKKISSLLRMYAVPGIIAQTAASLYNMVDSIYIGHIKDHYKEAAQVLKLPPLVYPSLLLLVGYPADDARQVRKPRFDKKYIVHENTYHRLTGEELTRMYSDRFFFTPKNTLGAENAAQQFYLNKYVKSPTYKNSVRSVHEVLKNWAGAEKIKFDD